MTSPNSISLDDNREDVLVKIRNATDHQLHQWEAQSEFAVAVRSYRGDIKAEMARRADAAEKKRFRLATGIASVSLVVSVLALIVAVIALR